MLGALSRPLIVTINTSTGSRTQNNATQYWLATRLSGYTVRNCGWGSNKSDNNNAGVAQLGMASSACQQLPIYIYEIYMKLATTETSSDQILAQAMQWGDIMAGGGAALGRLHTLGFRMF